MDILPLGHASFKIRGKNATVVTDPYDSAEVGLKFPKNTEADIVTVSHGHHDHDAVSAVSGSPFIVSGPGEYEIKGVSFIGITSFHDDNKGTDRGRNVVYSIFVDGLHIVHLGDICHVLTAVQIEELGVVDILFIPIGGVYTIDAEKAIEIISELEPKVVIPMHYKREGINEKIFGGLAPLSAFLSKIGKEIQSAPKLSITRDKLPAEMQVVVLE